MNRSAVRVLFISCICLAWLSAASQTRSEGATGPASTSRRPVIYVMPNALTSPGSGSNSEVIVGSAHNGQEPQVAKIYQELQQRKECQGFAENLIKDKADYFLLLQHGGGKCNRWALSDKEGTVIASGDSLFLGNSVKDACLAIARDWHQHMSAN
jgi:hypothetical protein